MLNHFGCEKIGIKPGIRGPSMVTGGIIGLMGGFMYAYQNSAGRIMGFFPNDGEVARYKKWHHFFGYFNKVFKFVTLFRQILISKFFLLFFLFFPWCFVLIVCFNEDNNSQTIVLHCIEKTPKNWYYQRPFWFWLCWFEYRVLWISECSVLWYYTSIMYNCGNDRVGILKSYLMWKSM